MIRKCRFGHITPNPLYGECDSDSKTSDIFPTCMHCVRHIPFHILEKFLEEKHAKLLNVKDLSQEPFLVKQQLHLKCTLDHEFKTNWFNMYFKQKWCPVCSKYKTENYVRSLFEKFSGGYKFPSVRPDWLNGLELDGYCDSKELVSKLKCLKGTKYTAYAWEVNGKQHYEFSPAYFHLDVSEFELLQARDRRKKAICEERGIYLVIIPYTVKDLHSFVKKQCLYI